MPKKKTKEKREKKQRPKPKVSSVVKPRDIVVLKSLALLGAVEEFVALSSRELGDILKTTQQTASLRIIDLLNRGYIIRKMGARKQGLKLSNKGIDVLRDEHADYMRIFELTKELEITGTVYSGIGEGKYYISQPEYKKQFKEKLWFVPFSGTLNVKLSGGELSKLKILRESEGIEIEGFEKDGRSFGSGKCFLAILNREECAVVIPKRSHYNDILEVISKTYLRDKLKLKDGDTVELHVSL